MHDLTPGARVEGQILLGGQDIYSSAVDPVEVRRRVGMVFQKPNPFPTMSVFDNVVSGLKLAGHARPHGADGGCRALPTCRSAVGRGQGPPQVARHRLSGGQQQRLCIARALAVEPEILLMDEPTSALDPASTARIEDLMTELKKVTTIIIVTHNMHQAARVSDTTSFFLNGDLVEHGQTNQIFTSPRDERTEAYVTGRFG